MGGLLVYVIGVPGAGKTALMKALHGERVRYQVYVPLAYGMMEEEESPRDGMPPVYVELGREREGFAGTDAMPLNVQPRALAYLEACPYSLILGEGDRLANELFFQGARERGWRVRKVLLDTPQSLASLRRAQRGSKQNARWVAGRVTKVARLGATADLVLHGAVPAKQNASHLRDRIRQWLLAELSEPGVSSTDAVRI